ncbi:MAG: LytTR family DNA-binding domain-containing protein [Acidobacteria bacterium]|nr:LytTR family DNA-binding domain-containing protein [Acidobacteriota bacterium]
MIVDDEALARRMVRKMLQANPEFEVVGECENGGEAVAALRSSPCDLVFLDVQMPEMDGFAVVSALATERMPHVIFVTAYDQYAVRAFEVHALDYLLKPFDQERFEQALERARRQVRGEAGGDINARLLSFLAQSESQPQPVERLLVKADGRVFFLKTDELEWIEAEGNYVSLHTGNKKYLYREAISTLETQLNPKQFRRISRSTIVNIDSVAEFQPRFRGDYWVVLRGGVKLKLSHRYRSNLDKDFGGSL